MIYFTREDANGDRPPFKNGLNIFWNDHRSRGFVLKLGRFGWRFRWSKYRKMLFNEVIY